MKLGMKTKGNQDKKRLAGITDYALLDTPVITEKSSLVGQSGTRFVFKVPSKSTKSDIKMAVEKIFGVNVVSVNTLNMLGKTKRTIRGVGRKPSFKKAYVTLAAGQTISVVEGL